MKKDFSGIYPALMTPFDKNGGLNERSYRALIDYNIKKGVDGFYVAGSSAEVFLLTDAERRRLYEIAADENAGRVNLIAHIGAISTEQSVEYGRFAKALGYDAVSAVAPFYYKFSFEQIKTHYFRIADKTNMPVIVYNFPGFSGVNLSVGDIGQFLGDDRFIGLKHTSNDFYALNRVKTLYPDKFVFNGFDEMFLAGLAMGADGGIGSTYNFMAEKFIAIRRLFREGKIGEAQKLQSEVDEIISAVLEVGVMAGVKEALTQLGIDCGSPRAPFSPLDDAQKKLVKDKIVSRLESAYGN